MVVKVVRFAIISMTVLGFLGWIYFPSFSRLKELKEREENLDKKIASLESEIKELETEIKLADTPEYKRYILRKEYNLLRRGEYILNIE